MAYKDLEKSFDRVNRNHLWQILNRRIIPYHSIEVIKSYTKIPVYNLTHDGKSLAKYTSNKENDRGVI